MTHQIPLERSKPIESWGAVNTLKIKRTWLTYRSDAAAGVAIILFMVAAFWAAGGFEGVAHAVP